MNEDLNKQSELMPVLEGVAELKGLQVFLFKGEELREYYGVHSEKIGVALMAKTKDNAIHNLRRLSKCYLIELGA